jgi:hypothetical protein
MFVYAVLIFVLTIEVAELSMFFMLSLSRMTHTTQHTSSYDVTENIYTYFSSFSLPSFSRENENSRKPPRAACSLIMKMWFNMSRLGCVECVFTMLSCWNYGIAFNVWTKEMKSVRLIWSSEHLKLDQNI